MKKKLLTTIFISLLSAALVIGQDKAVPAQPSIELPPNLARVLTDYENAWRNRDADGLSKLFTENGFVLQNGGQPVRGRLAIKEAYKNSGGPLVLRAIAFEIENKIAYIIGGFSRTKGEPDIGKFTLTLKKDKKGRWLIMSDMDSPNTSSR